MQTNPAVEQNKNIKWSESPWNQSGNDLFGERYGTLRNFTELYNGCDEMEQLCLRPPDIIVGSICSKLPWAYHKVLYISPLDLAIGLILGYQPIPLRQ